MAKRIQYSINDIGIIALSMFRRDERIKMSNPWLGTGQQARENGRIGIACEVVNIAATSLSQRLYRGAG